MSHASADNNEAEIFYEGIRQFNGVLATHLAGGGSALVTSHQPINELGVPVDVVDLAAVSGRNS